jgi:hypothetical protein
MIGVALIIALLIGAVVAEPLKSDEWNALNSLLISLSMCLKISEHRVFEDLFFDP